MLTIAILTKNYGVVKFGGRRFLRNKGRRGAGTGVDMTREEIWRFLAAAHTGIICVNGRNEWPVPTPCGTSGGSDDSGTDTRAVCPSAPLAPGSSGQLSRRGRPDLDRIAGGAAPRVHPHRKRPRAD